MHVLIIDDDQPTRDALSAVLEGEGYSVSQAANGRDALDMLEHIALPDVVLLDMMMPVMTGWRFIEIVRSHPIFRALSLVVVSSASDEWLEVTGAKAIVRKPLNLDRLLRLLPQLVPEPRPAT
jgi:CheY-like chemotaxis protein